MCILYKNDVYIQKKGKFGELAATKELITKWQLEQALAEQKANRNKGLVHKKIGVILSEKGHIGIDAVKNILEIRGKSTFWSWMGVFFMFKRGI